MTKRICISTLLDQVKWCDLVEVAKFSSYHIYFVFDFDCEDDVE